MNATLVADVVREVMQRLEAPSPRHAGSAATQPSHSTGSAPSASAEAGRYGVYATVEQAVAAATEAQKQLLKLSMDDRERIIRLVKRMAKDNARPWGRMEFDETRIGRLDHKIQKLEIIELVPGTEYLRTVAHSGSNGVALDEFAPFGVIGAITPVTHSVPTLTANFLAMVAAGNTIVFNAHPSGANCAAHAVREYNKAIAAEFGIENIACVIHPPTLRTAAELFQAKGINLLVVTGGPAVARAALESKKRAIVAGPGNPPVVVDETADLDNAARSIVAGGGYDNNLLCIGEKQVFVVESVFEAFAAALRRHKAHWLSAQQVQALTRKAFTTDEKTGKPHLTKDLVGKDTTELAAAAGASIAPGIDLLVGETNKDHPFVQEEQMMPFVPVVRCRNVDEAIDWAVESEHGFRHTAIIHSRNLDNITRFGRLANTTLFIVNGASMSGLGLDGEGYLSYSIATPTGEGVTTPLTFTRFRRVMMTGALRMI
mgnify:CR=1 FL=1